MSQQHIIHGNNLDLLARMPDCSVDAVVTDPPYGLAAPDQVKRAINRVAKVFEHSSLPDLYDWDLQAKQESTLTGVGDRGAPLGGVLGAIRVGCGVGVPEGSVHLDSDTSDHEVDTRPKAPGPGVSDGNLPIEGDTPQGQFLGDYIFHPGHSATGSGDMLRGGLPELYLGGFSVPVVAALPACFPCAGGAISAHDGVYGAQDIGLDTDPLGQPGGPPSVVTGAGAILRAVLRFDIAGVPRELGLAPSADDEHYGDTSSPNLVRARSGASRLATMAKPFRVCLVGGLADGTDSFFHLWLPFKLPVVKLPRGGFMGKSWDAALPDPRTWAECLRVLKPGGHLVAFGAPRLYHRLACQIEDAGFELKDCLMWLFGSGFPKSLDVSKAIDKARDDTDAVRVVCRWLRAHMEACGATSKSVSDHFGYHSRMVDHWAARDTDSQPNLPTLEQWDELRAYLGLPEDMDAEVLRLNLRKGQPGEAWEGRPVTGTVAEWTDRANFAITSRDGLARDIPITPAAQKWAGFGTALKPAYEPIVLARKPLAGTVAANVLAHGTGALNIDGCRIAGEKGVPASLSNAGGLGWSTGGDMARKAEQNGRWPANLILDEEAGALLDAQTGTDMRKDERPAKGGSMGYHGGGTGTHAGVRVVLDSGGASRFFKSASLDTEELIIHHAKAMLLGWNPDLANTADDSSNLPRAFVDSALNDAATWADLGVTLSVEWTEHTTSVTPKESRRIVEVATATILSIAQGCSLEWLRGRRFQSSSLVSRAERSEQTDTTRITVSHWRSDGSADPVTLNITPKSSGLGEADSASRAYYCPKASRAEREAGLDHLPERVVDPTRAEGSAGRDNPRTGAGRKGGGRKNHHSTVKPIALMQWLVRLVCPPGGIVLEPFAGSGSTLVACALEDRDAIGMELDAEYVTIARARVAHARQR